MVAFTHVVAPVNGRVVRAAHAAAVARARRHARSAGDPAQVVDAGDYYIAGGVFEDVAVVDGGAVLVAAVEAGESGGGGMGVEGSGSLGVEFG